MRKTASGVLVVLALVLAGLATIAPAAPSFAAPSIAVLGPNVTLLAGQVVPPGSPTTASVITARNEFESFQVVVSPTSAIGNLKVALAGDLTAGGGATLDTTAFTFYREAYYQVQSAPADVDNRTDGESAVGDWPDALIPQTDYIYGEHRGAFSAAVPAGGRVVLWVDVLAPADQAPGTYTGSVQVSDGNTLLTSVPVSATVRNFSIPSTSTLKNLFLTEWGQQCAAYGHIPQCDWVDHVPAMKYQALYERVALENRMTISNPWPVNKDETLASNSRGENLTAHWNQYVRPVVNGNPTDPALGTQNRLAGARATVLTLRGQAVKDEDSPEPIAWGCRLACINTWTTAATNGNWLDRLVYYTCDEPGGSAVKWARCSDNHAFVDQADVALPELVTAPIGQLQSHGADAWTDVTVPLTGQMAGKASSAFVGNQRPSYTPWLGQVGDGQANDVWLYSACDQGGCDGPTNSPTWNISFWNGWPGYGIDQPASQARAMSWLAYLYDAPGELYWGATTKLSQAWDTCTSINSQASGNCLYDSGMGGDGTLFYPGRACAVGTGPGCIGGTKDIPIESIRLKRIRDGREDYEYLHQLATSAAAGDRQLARTTALNLFGGSLDSATYNTTFGQAALDQARDALGDALDVPVTVTPTVGIGDATITEGTGTDKVMHFTVTTHGDGGEGYVDLTGVAGSADATDFTVDIPSLDLAADSTYDVPVTVAGDAVEEATETFSVEMSFNQGYAMSDSTGVGTILDDDTEGPVTVFRPDAKVKQVGDAYVGAGIYDNSAATVGSDQTVTVKARRGVTRTFAVKITNRGNTADSWAIAESPAPAPSGFARRYLQGSTNITQDVVTGNLSYNAVAVGDSRTIRVTVTPKKGTAIGTVGTWYLHAVHSPTSDHLRDVVRIRVKVVR